ncbi:tyrosine--tRNA ligase [Myxococcota bacterium]|nr:tyrosine--tRNA ligase [Myxococcota bacterium]MBU1429004.1 tyrosine--tRNA ligase [Myxococcota bacterium]MBU1896993.1 tyrosine--tRNA ligase [Myxococcota bacterium]
MKPVNPRVDLEELFDGAAEIIGREALEEKIRSGKRLIVKHGVDPTARDLHLGYAVNYQVMRRFQDAGHTVVLLIGDYTSRIGDPTGKDKTRPQLTLEVIEANIASMIEQVDRVLDTDSLIIRRNSAWFDEMKLQDFLSLGTRLSAARLWERDMFKRRLSKGQPVYIHEFLYPILQGYDSYMLESDITINGSDQKFNELMGREIQSLLGQSPQAIMVMPILPGTDGVEKMSQSLGNYIGLAEPPEEQYGKVLSIPDALIEDFYRLATRLPRAETDQLLGALGPMEAKMRLAREIVAQYHSVEAAAEAEAHFIRVHREHAAPEEIPELEIDLKGGALWICQALNDAGLVKSNGEARRTIQGGGLKLDGEAMTDIGLSFTAPGEHLIQKGKRHFLRLKLR